MKQLFLSKRDYERRKFIVLTGGPGGGKTTLIQELVHDSYWKGRFLTLPEAIGLAGGIGIPTSEKAFQRLMVEIQFALEKAVNHTLEEDDPRLVICHRGSLDPLAYWLDRGWQEDEFFTFTKTKKEQHYARYREVIHLVTAADGAESHYIRWPEAHRPESTMEAVRLDHLLEQVWGSHSGYHKVDNQYKDWRLKAEQVKQVLSEVLNIKE